MAAPSAVVELTILQTTDIHAHIHDPDGNAGWLRLATAIGKERAAVGGKGNCLLIDCGDTVQGTLAGAVSLGEVSIAMLNALQYDA